MAKRKSFVSVDTSKNYVVEDNSSIFTNFETTS